MMLAAVDRRTVGAFERGHLGIERNVDEFADRVQSGSRIPREIVVLQLIDRSPSADQFIGLALHAAVTQNSAEIRSRPGKPWRLHSSANNAAADVGGVAPDHDELRIRIPV